MTDVINNRNLTEQINLVFKDSIVQVISTVAGFDLYQVSNDSEMKSNQIIAMLQIKGTTNGVVIVDVDHITIKIITSYMTGIEEKYISKEDMLDCVGEIANMICGVSKARLKEYEFYFDLLPPFSFSGDNIDFLFKRGMYKSELTFSDEQIKICVRILLF